jgi:hypothetical protein
MKKTFFEPEVHKIELNLRENIATSETGSDMYVKVLQANYFTCTVHRTGKLIFNCTESDLKTCTVYGSAGDATVWSLEKTFPLRELLPYIKR